MNALHLLATPQAALRVPGTAILDRMFGRDPIGRTWWTTDRAGACS